MNIQILTMPVPCSQCHRPLTVTMDWNQRSAPTFNRHLGVNTIIIALAAPVRCQCNWKPNAVLAHAQPFKAVMAYNEFSDFLLDPNDVPMPGDNQDYVSGDKIIAQSAGGDLIGGDKIEYLNYGKH